MTVSVSPQLVLLQIFGRLDKNPQYQVFEAALRRYLGLEGTEAIWAHSDLNEDEALALTYRELHASRKTQ